MCDIKYRLQTLIDLSKDKTEYTLDAVDIQTLKDILEHIKDLDAEIEDLYNNGERIA